MPVATILLQQPLTTWRKSARQGPMKFKNPLGLRVVAREGKNVASSAPAPHPPHTTIHKHGYVADIIISDNNSGQIFHYVIQREGSTEIIHWGQELSLKRAIDCVEYHLATLRNHTA